jgi:hypothetical protein
MDTIDIGNREDRRSRRRWTHQARDPEHQAIHGKLPTDFQE